MVIPAYHLAGNRSNTSALDFYATPPSATRSLMQRIKFNGRIWECASGRGDMAKVIEQYNECFSSDISESEGTYGTKGVDFLSMDEAFSEPNIVTNPPYKLAEQFVWQADRLSSRKYAMFLRLNFLESQSRYSMFKKLPLEWILVFSKRQVLHPEGVVVSTGGTIAYAWFVWNKFYSGKPQVDWIND